MRRGGWQRKQIRAYAKRIWTRRASRRTVVQSSLTLWQMAVRWDHCLPGGPTQKKGDRQASLAWLVGSAAGWRVSLVGPDEARVFHLTPGTASDINRALINMVRSHAQN